MDLCMLICTSMISFQKSKCMISISVFLVTPILNHADLWSLVPIRTYQTCLLHCSSQVPIALFIHGYPEPWWLLLLLRAVWSNSMIFTRSAVWLSGIFISMDCSSHLQYCLNPMHQDKSHIQEVVREFRAFVESIFDGNDIVWRYSFDSELCEVC
jgi:hypothetical protein